MEHKSIAFVLSEYFYVHIKEELAKSQLLIDTIRFDGRTPRIIDNFILKELISMFPDLESQNFAGENIFRLWSKKNNFALSYDDFSFEAYNLIFLERIKSIYGWSKESRFSFHDETIKIFRKFDYKQTGFSISFFIRSENNMREILRTIIQDSPLIVDKEKAWELLFEQSKEYQEVVNEFFEDILKESLARSEKLLLNILPLSISDELKEKGKVEPKNVLSATVLFTDFKGFTKITENMNPGRLIKELDRCFSIFDKIIEKCNLEKIKTIGDSYMCAGGIPIENNTHAIDAALAAIYMRNNIIRLKEIFDGKGLSYWEVRIGFHTGSIVAGVIGNKKFSYDIWGDTVNIASRMESSGIPGKINISEESYQKIKRLFDCESRGDIEAKNKGKMRMYFLNGILGEFSENGNGVTPNKEFYKIYSEIKNTIS